MIRIHRHVFVTLLVLLLPMVAHAQNRFESVRITSVADNALCVGQVAPATTCVGGIKAGKILTGEGSAAAPAVQIGATAKGMYGVSADILGFAVGGSAKMWLFGDTLQLPTNTAVIAMGTSPDVYLVRIAANTLGLASGTADQTFQVYGDATNITTNYQRLAVGNDRVQMQTAGSAAGTVTGLVIGTTGHSSGYIQFRTGTDNNRWSIGPTGHFVADGAYNITTTGVASAPEFRGASSSRIHVATDANITLTSSAGTTFGLLQFGGTTSAFPALKRSGDDIRFRLADDSADADVIAREITGTSNIIGNQLFSGASGVIGWVGRSLMRSPGDGNLRLVNNAESAGIGLVFSTDNTLIFRDRATLSTTYATISPSGLSVGGGAFVASSDNIAQKNAANVFTALQTVQLTTVQQQLGYDGSNYFTTTVGSAGLVTFNAVGASQGFVFNDAVSMGDTLTMNGTTPKITFTGDTAPEVLWTNASAAARLTTNNSMYFSIDANNTSGGEGFYWAHNASAGTVLMSLLENGTLTVATVVANLTGNVTGNVSGSSGSTTGNAATATALQTARNINGVSFNGTANIDITTISGNAGTATALETGRTINGVTFDGTSNIVITVDAADLTGTTLDAGITASSLTSVGTLSSLGVSGNVAAGSYTADGSNGCSGVPNDATFGITTSCSSFAEYQARILTDIPERLGFVEGAVRILMDVPGRMERLEREVARLTNLVAVLGGVR